MVGIHISRQELKRLMRDFYQLTGITITFWTVDGKLYEEVPEGKRSDFCEMIRSVQSLDQRCHACDQQALQQAQREAKTHVYRCAAGLLECIYPALHENTLLGYFMIGQLRQDTDGEMVFLRHEEFFSSYGLNVGELKKAYTRLPQLSSEQIDSAARMLEALAGYCHLKGLVRQCDLPLVERINQYILTHLSQPVRLDQVAKALSVSRSTICHTMRAEKNQTFVEYCNYRKAQAAVNLVQKGKSLSEAAHMVGFSSSGYLSRICKKHLGASPKDYWKRKSTEEEDTF